MKKEEFIQYAKEYFDSMLIPTKESENLTSKIMNYVTKKKLTN
ncbi:MAG: hypothetical protein ACI4PF_00505 [Christensenellales bacterium]